MPIKVGKLRHTQLLPYGARQAAYATSNRYPTNFTFPPTFRKRKPPTRHTRGAGGGARVSSRRTGSAVHGISRR